MNDIPSPEEILDFTPPTKASLRKTNKLLRTYFKPTFLGSDTLNLDRPALWVGNHTLFAMFDTPLMMEHIYCEHDVFIRGLGDRMHFDAPWAKTLIAGGMVLGSPEHCKALMTAGEHILVFPGGGREVMRRKGEEYKLIWKKRTGFARLAIENGYDIIPFGVVGPDDNYNILVDAEDITNSRPWQWLSNKFPVITEKTRGGDAIPPIVRGIGASVLPRPQRFYFGFGKRIRTAQLKKNTSNPDALWAMREKVAAAVEGQISMLKQYREGDHKNWGAVRRFLAPIKA